MGQIPKSGKPDSVTAVSRRTVLGAGASVGLATAAVDWPEASLRPIAAKAADPTLANRSSRQLAAFQIRHSSLRFDATPRLICSARELAEYVHRDFSFQPYMNAALIILALGNDALSPTNPYRGSRTQFGDITLGSKNVLSMLAQAALLGEKGAYFHKWQVHRRLRPECFAGRIETHATGRRQYDLHADILHCDAVARVQSQYGTRLLPVAFPEGCPTHPSYPSAHACNAGACATILKAFFDTDYVLPRPVEATADGLALEPWRGARLALGNEIDKLASNIALGRDAAGVHYRSDSINGLGVGEQQAIGLLRDYSRTYNERFDGFVVRKFNGEKVKIMAGEVRPL